MADPDQAVQVGGAGVHRGLLGDQHRSTHHYSDDPKGRTSGQTRRGLSELPVVHLWSSTFAW